MRPYLPFFGFFLVSLGLPLSADLAMELPPRLQMARPGGPSVCSRTFALLVENPAGLL